MAKPSKNSNKVQIKSNKSNKTSLNECFFDSIGLFSMHAYAFMVLAKSSNTITKAITFRVRNLTYYFGG